MGRGGGGIVERCSVHLRDPAWREGLVLCGCARWNRNYCDTSMSGNVSTNCRLTTAKLILGWPIVVLHADYLIFRAGLVVN